MGERFIIFGRSTCPFCTMAEDLLCASELEFLFLDYATNAPILEEYKKFYNQETVPIILSNDLQSGYTKKVGGYTDLLEYIGEK